MTTRVSVIIPTHFRSPELLGTAVESALRQRGAEVEVVVVNDGGPPDTLPGEFRRDRRVRYAVLSRSIGPCRARNLGIRIASGSHIAYLDDDDLYAPDHLRRLLRTGARVAYADVERRIQDGDRILRSEYPYALPFSPDALLVGNYIPLIALLHERSCVDEAGGFDPAGDLLEDWEMILRWSRRWTFIRAPEATAIYINRVRSDQRSNADDRSLASVHAIYRRTRHLAASTPGVSERRRLALQRRRMRAARGLRPWDPVELEWMFP